MLNFSLGAGFSPRGAVAVIDKWIQGVGVQANARIDGTPVPHILIRRLSHRFGAGAFRIHQGHLWVSQDGKWTIHVHRDDIRNWISGQELTATVGVAPDPSESGVKVDVVEYEESVHADGKPVYKCGACSVTRRKEELIIKHIEEKH